MGGGPNKLDFWPKINIFQDNVSRPTAESTKIGHDFRKLNVQKLKLKKNFHQKMVSLNDISLYEKNEKNPLKSR